MDYVFTYRRLEYKSKLNRRIKLNNIDQYINTSILYKSSPKYALLITSTIVTTVL